MTKMSEDRNNDGLDDFIREFEYDENGRLISESYSSFTDGYYGHYLSSSGTTTYEYDKNGNLIKEGNGITYEYDANGNRIKEFHDSNNDGEADYTYLYKYDDNGNLIKEIEGYNPNGAADKVTAYEYDDNGNIIKESVDGDKGDADGVYDCVITYEYNEFGDKIKTSYDLDANGVFEKIFENFENGNQKDTYDYDQDGKADYICEFDKYV